MNGQLRRPRHVRSGSRQAIVAIVASLLTIAMIALVTDEERGGALAPAVTVAPSTSTATTTTATTTTPATATPATPTTTTPGTSQPTETVSDVPTDVSTPGSTPPVEAATTLPAGLPSIDAAAFAVYDVTGARWLAESHADVPLPVGSVMKLLTSYVVLQAGDLGRIVTVPALDVDISESSVGLYAGEQLPRDVLLRAMLIVSANDAARALAIDIGGTTDGFVEQMNAAAAELGLSNTVAANPIGLDAAGAHSSAHDMVTLAALLMQDQTFRGAVAKPGANLHGQTFAATNKLLTSYAGANGVKTGHTTDAGYCLIGSATRDGRTFIVAVLGASSEANRLAGATALLDWAFGQR